MTQKFNKIKLRSWKNDYLHRPDSAQGVTSWSTGIGNEWTVEWIHDDRIKLKSWKGDYLQRPELPQGVDTGSGNEWTIERIDDTRIKLKSCKGDYLHRPDVPQGVTTWSTGIGNEWTVEILDAGEDHSHDVKKVDDLTVVEGIGPKIAELFAKGGIHSYADLAKATVAHLKELLAAGGSHFGTANPTTWPEQAKLAAEGRMDALKELQAKLKGGRSV